MRTDIILAANLDLEIDGNDFKIDSSNHQHGRLILGLKQGDLSQYPKVGVAIIQYLKGAFDGAARRNVQLQFESDAYRVDGVNFNTNTGALNINFNLKNG